ncbi:DUF1592 domain-containing protein [Akkermansiaceae bacterium]|jgi:mono/diheme cytochrome c family protein|nr:DUF1592 domain-containing protein [Akkermansiaceae bacterium]
MLNYPITKVAAFLVFAAVHVSTSRADDRTQSQQFFKTYCVSCHGEEKSKGGLRLDQIDAQHWNDPSLLDDIYEAIESGEMPPEDAPKLPEPDQIKALQKAVGNQLHHLVEKQKPGMLKRLSRVEYQNTVNDVFGTDFSLLDRLPLDNIEAGFNNNADNLHMSVVDMESYFKTANLIAESVVSEKPDPRVIVYSTKDTDIDTHSHKDNTNGFAPTLPRASRPLVFATQSIQIKINPSVKTSGVYQIVPKGFYIQAKYVAGSRVQERLPAVTDVSELNANEWPSDHSMSYFLRKNSGVGQSIVTVIPKNAAWQEFDPSVGFTTQLSSDDTIVLRCNSVKGGLQPMFCIESATISGPVYESWPPETYFYKTYCKDLEASAGPEACQAILNKLARKLFRGPVSDAEMQPFYQHATKAFARDQSIYSGLQAGIRGMLCSPKFLFKQEGESGSLDDYAIAARMSYFLWNSLPDETLSELAKQGKLKDPKIRREQTLRMLQDARAGRFVKDYVYQWLDLEKLKIIEPDLGIFTVEEFDLVRNQIKEEPVEFFKEVLSSNLSLVNFIDSDFVMISPELNYIYRIEGHPVATPRKRPGASKISPKDYRPKEITSEFSKVMLGEKDRYRGGLLTQAGFMLMTTNNGEYTNPFYRGAWVLKSFYGDHLETPEDLEISALSPPTKTVTIKETIDAHRADVSCNICHKKMDPLGIALENFDVLGRWRDQYTDVSNYAPKGKKKGGRFPVDTRTVHMDGRAFEGPQGLKTILMEDKEKFTKAFVENMLSYAMARELNFPDRENISQLYKQSAETNFRLRDILLEIVSSDYFTRR